MVYRISTAVAMVLMTAGVGTAQTLGIDGQQPGDQVAAIDEASRDVKPAEWPEDPNRTRLLFGTNARALRQGELYLDIIGINAATIQAGITDRISLGAGTPFLIPARPLDIYWITPKVQLYSGQRTSTALGVIHIVAGDAKIGVAYGAVTHGSPRGSVSAGVGYAYAKTDEDGEAVPVIQLGADRRLSRRVTLLTENYIGEGMTMLSGGVRFIRGNRAVDIGMFVHPQTRVKLPMIRWTMAFGDGHERQ